MRVRVAGAQVPVGTDVRANLAAVLRAIEFAAAESADVLLTPEGSLSGYRRDFDAGELDRALLEVVSAARGKVALALGTCHVEPADGRCYNQVRFYDRDGELVGFHAKVLRCGTLTDPPTGEVEDFATAPLRTFRLCGLTVGALICNDLWANPMCTPMPDAHLAQALARMGARVIFHAVNGGRDGSEDSRLYWQFHEANLRIRARAAKVWIVTADNCAPTDMPCSSPSGVIDPTGKWVCRTEPAGEQFFVHTVGE